MNPYIDQCWSHMHGPCPRRATSGDNEEQVAHTRFAVHWGLGFGFKMSVHVLVTSSLMLPQCGQAVDVDQWGGGLLMRMC